MTVLLVAAGFGAVLVLRKGVLTPRVLLTIYLMPIIAGYIVLDDRQSTSVAPWYAAGVVVALLGSLAVRPGPARRRELTGGFDPVPVFVVVALASLHFLLAGVPVFRSTLEVDRFNFSASGLLGLPGRMYLFGLPLAAAYVSTGTDTPKSLQRLAWAALVLSRIAAGFKGGILVVVELWLLVRWARGQPYRLRAGTTVRLVGLVGLASVFALNVALVYPTIRAGQKPNDLGLLWERSTIGAAGPGHAVLTNRDVFRTEESVLENDSRYFVAKYFHLGTASSPRYPLDQRVSAYQHGTPLRLGSFLVPVTVGAYPAWTVDLGRAGALVAMAAVGLGVGAAIRVAASGSPLHRATGVFLLDLLITYVMNGGLAYTVINGAAALGVFWTLSSVAGHARVVAASHRHGFVDTEAARTVRCGRRLVLVSGSRWESGPARGC